MGNLKISFKYLDAEFLIDGEESIVRQESEVFRKFIVENFSDKKIEKQSVIDSDFVEPLDGNAKEHPILKEVVMKDLPKTEIEWVLIYALYASDFGNRPFTEVDIKGLYDSSNRKNSSRMKNFSANFSKNVSNGYIKILNDNEYILTSSGNNYTSKILSGSSNASKREERKKSEGRSDVVITKSKKAKSKASSSFNVSIVNDLNLKPKDRISLKDLVKQYILGSNYEKNTIFLYYLKKTLKIEEVGINHVYTCYKDVSERVPKNLYQSLVDTKNVKGWIDSKNMENLQLTISGENFIEYDLKRIE